jgi:hypothetical protein
VKETHFTFKVSYPAKGTHFTFKVLDEAKATHFQQCKVIVAEIQNLQIWWKESEQKVRRTVAKVKVDQIVTEIYQGPIKSRHVGSF